MDIYPSFFARFYDLIYATIRSDVDTAFFMKKMKEANGKVLEVGVGTGRLFLEGLKNGVDIYGIDISPEMLEILKRKIDKEEYFRVSQQDIRDFDLGFQFSTILAPFRVFMHLIETNDQVKALNHVYNQLEDGGSFIFDLYVPAPKLLASGMSEQLDFEGEFEPGNKVRRYVTSHSDMINQVNHLAMRFDWNEGEQKFSETWNSELRFFFRYELEYLLGNSKFKSWSIFGDYLENPLSKESKEFVVVCRK
jgi:phospholipid N-methyltransferase